MNKSPLIPSVQCHCCEGTGRVPLNRDLWQTLERLRKLGSAFSCDLLEKGITSGAINNRLVDLEKLGLIKRAGKTGKWIEWEAVKL